MMSHNGLPHEYDDHRISGPLELSIETLAGTAFEIKVSPNDTIMSIKSKIQRAERIPVSEQHLLYNLKELKDSASVQDYSIQNGATLKLVLSMKVGPVTNKRLPSPESRIMKELQELRSGLWKNDSFERLPSKSRVTVLVFRDGDQVNFLKVVENEDGSFSPLSDSWNGTSIRNLFPEENIEESEERLKENSVTMGKMQELREKLATLSIQRKEKKAEDSSSVLELFGKLNSGKNGREEILRRHGFVSLPSGDFSRSNCVTLIRRAEQELNDSPPFRTRSEALTKAREEMESILRVQTDTGETVDPEPGHWSKRTPLPSIRRSPRAESETEESLGKNTRGKTARSFAILEEEDPTTGPQSSSEEVATRSRFSVSKYVLEGEERPKTTPGKLDNREGKFCGLEPKRATHILSTLSNVLPRASSKSQADVHDEEKKSSQQKKRASRNPSYRGEAFCCPPHLAQKLHPAATKKRLRCFQCKKKLNITNTYTCRCERTLCTLHRCSEVHNCLFDYKREGRRILRQTNPLVVASKLPKI